jgi:sec-independent protein translocase protein TatA
MGLGGIGMSELLVIMVIVVLLFGTKRLGSIGSDLGTAIRGFRKAMKGDDAGDDKRINDQGNKPDVKDGEKRS